MKYTLTVLSCNNGQARFTEDCLKEIVEKTKSIPTGIGNIENLRYEDRKILGDLDINFVVKTFGKVLQELETPRGNVITSFETVKAQIMIVKKNETK